MRAFALKKGRKLVEVSINETHLWRMARDIETDERAFWGSTVYKSEKDRMREKGWSVIPVTIGAQS